jgi:hypothetical protein
MKRRSELRDGLRENKADQTFIRRIPSTGRGGAAPKRRYRYTYDVDLATRVNVPARVGEKIRIPYRNVLGHYEVVERLAPDVVALVHDEAKHALVISDAALRELARDTYRPGDGGAPSEEDVRLRHEREDALPRSRDEAYRTIQDASGIDDHDFAKADEAYRHWKAERGKKRRRPPQWEGGELDVFRADMKKGKNFSSLLEAFEHASRGARTWRDLEPVLVMLRDVPGFENARFPDEVYERHNRHDAELDEQGHTIDVDLYGMSVPAGASRDAINEAIFLASTLTPPNVASSISEEDAARAAREEEGVVEEDDDLALWGF